MKTLKIALLAVMLAPSLAGTAPPSDLFTPILNVAGNMLVCNVVNASDNFVSGSLGMWSPDGVPVTATAIPFNLAPGHGAVVAANSGFDGYCRITVVGKTDSVRANLCVMKLGEGCIATADAR